MQTTTGFEASIREPIDECPQTFVEQAVELI